MVQKLLFSYFSCKTERKSVNSVIRAIVGVFLMYLLALSL